MDQLQVIRDFLRMLRRRALLLGIVATLGILASGVYAFIKPPVYETSAKILIESQQIPDDLARSTVNVSAAERLRLIEERLLSRNSLIEVIDEFALFTDLSELSLGDKVDLFRQAIRIETISVSGRQGQGNEVFAFTIAVRLGDAEQAAAVVNGFVESAIEQNLRVRAERTRDTLKYFEDEAKRVGTAIEAVGGEITAFKNANAAALPENLEYRRDELARQQESSLEIERRILDIEEARGALQIALAGGSPSLAGGRPLLAGGNPLLGRLEDQPAARSPEEVELRRLALQLELELAQSRSVLGPTHPGIQLLQERITGVGNLLSSVSADPPALTGLGGSTEERRAAIQRQIGLHTSQIAQLQNQKKATDARRAELETSIRDTPQVEMELNALNRRIVELQDQHSVITRRRAEARTGEQLETNQQSERFQVIEHALVPDDPVAPDRKKVVALGSGASIAVAFGLVFLLEMLNPALRTSAQMERQLGIRPVVSIPYVPTPAERRRRWLPWLLGLVVIAGVLYGAVELVDRYVIPLEAIGETIGEGLEDFFDAVGKRS